jgi:hypothetical protein
VGCLVQKKLEGGGYGVCLGILRFSGCFVVAIRGEVVVDCVAKVVRRRSFFRGLKVGHLFRLIFCAGAHAGSERLMRGGGVEYSLLELRGLGRKIKNSTMPPTMTPTMIRTRSAPGQPFLFSRGVEVVSMVGWMRNPDLRFFGGRLLA